MKRVLVTGGAGFIGSHVTEELIEEGFQVAVVDNLSTGNRSFIPDSVSLYHLDITSSELRYVFQDFQPDVVVHLAAQSKVSYSVQHPREDAQNNILGTVQILELCVEFGVARVVYASSAAVYGHVQDLPITEATPAIPLSPYGISKYTGEQYVKIFGELHGISAAVLRFANVYGTRQSQATEAGVIPVFIEDLLMGKSPIIYGDGRQTRDFIFVRDVARAVVKAVQSKACRTYHVSTSAEVSVQDILKTIGKLTDTHVFPIYQSEKPGDIYRSCLSNTKAKQGLNWSPTTSLESGLAQTIAYYRQIQNYTFVRGKVEADEENR